MVIERLFVTGNDLSAALDPAGRAPATAVRRLREQGYISHGIELKPHRQGRLRGAKVLYCALNLDAVESYRDGDEAGARALAEAAAAIEVRPAVRDLAKTLAEAGDLRVLPAGSRRVATQVARQIARERSRFKHAGPLVGLVIAADERFATVDTRDETIVLPRETLRVRGLDHPGAAVAIRSHHLRSGAMVHSADEAYELDDEDRGGARPFDPFAMRAERRGPDAAATLEAALKTGRPVRLLAPLVVSGR